MFQSGDIIFIKGKSSISRIIRWFDTGSFSHVCIAISKTHIVEAQWFTKARVTPFYFGNDDITVIDLNLTDEERHKVVKIALQNTGTWYDYPSLLWYVMKKFIKLDGRNLLNNPNNMICSELVYRMLTSIGLLSYTENLEDLTPNELYNFLTIFCENRERGCEMNEQSPRKR